MMRKAVTGVLLGAVMMTVLSGCTLWWTETFSDTQPGPNGGWYGRSVCEVDMYPDATSGYVKEWAVDGPSFAWNVSGDVAWVINTQPNHYVSSDTYLWAAAGQAGVSQGEKYITGIYPGEAYRMGYASGRYATVNMRTRVVDGAGNVINTNSNCQQISA